MIRPPSGLALALLALPLLLPTASTGADEEGFRPLFDGTSLDGWVQPDGRSLFSVEDGEIVGRTDGDLKKNEFLVTGREHGDFVLKAKVKVLSGNSGIQFRSRRAPDGAVSGPQADAAEGWWGLLYEERGRGILERYPAEKAAAIVRPDDWNEFVIEARGDHVLIALNGTPIIDRTDPAFPASGVIALQVHTGKPMEVRFKDIAIKPLD